MPGHGERFIQTFDDWFVRINKRVVRLERRVSRLGGSQGGTTTSGTAAWSANFVNYDADAGSPLRWVLQGDTVYLRGVAKPATQAVADSLPAGGATMAILPPQLWPASTVVGVQQSSSTNRWALRIGESGVLTAQRHDGAAPSTNTWLPINIVYRKDQ